MRWQMQKAKGVRQDGIWHHLNNGIFIWSCLFAIMFAIFFRIAAPFLFGCWRLWLPSSECHRRCHRNPCERSKAKKKRENWETEKIGFDVVAARVTDEEWHNVYSRSNSNDKCLCRFYSKSPLVLLVCCCCFVVDIVVDVKPRTTQTFCANRWQTTNKKSKTNETKVDGQADARTHTHKLKCMAQQKVV